MDQERYALVGGKALRRGYTTGSCAAAAAAAAARRLLTGEETETIRLDLPEGGSLELLPLDYSAGPGWAMCAVRKDSGDDPDITNGMLVYARVETAPSGVTVDGGTGVGRVTRPGLECAVGEAAINRVPRRMIAEAVRAELARAGCAGGARVVVSMPRGEELARKTYNPRLGIVGGLSVLGTTGIVEPMSEQALVDSIRLELRMLAAGGIRRAAVTPGSYGETFARETLGLDLSGAVKCSNFVGETLDSAVALGFTELLLVGHLGKFVKLAGGIFQTHSHVADARMEILTAHAALAGAEAPLLRRLMRCITTDDALEALTGAGLREAVLASLTERIGYHLCQRVGPEVRAEAAVFSNRYGLLGQTPGAAGLMNRFGRDKGETT